MLKVENDKHVFWFFLSIHCLLWLAIFLWIDPTSVHDGAEGFMWSQHLQWGYDKHPWLYPATIHFLGLLGLRSALVIFISGIVYTASAFIGTWLLARKILPPWPALISVLVLEACLYTSIYMENFNNNTAMIGLWPWMFLFFYEALMTEKRRYWVLLGVVAGLSMMGKYYTLLAFASMFIFMLANPLARKAFKASGLYLAILIMLLICTPNFIWLAQHNFISIHYAAERGDDYVGHSLWQIYFAHPLIFFAKLFFQVSFAFLIVLSFKWASKVKASYEITAFNKSFINYILLGPFILTLICSLLLKITLPTEWGEVLTIFFGIILVAFIKPALSMRAKKIFVLVMYSIMLLIVLGYIIPIKYMALPQTRNYPAPEIAQSVTDLWHQKYHQPLKYVGGSRYIGGYVAMYSPDHPSVWPEWDGQYSSWVNVADIKKSGAIFIQDGYDDVGTDPTSFPPEMLKDYPNLIILPEQIFNYRYKAEDASQKAIVLIGILPPESN